MALCACSLTPNYDMIGMFYGQSPRNDQRFEESMQINKQREILSDIKNISLATDDYKIYVATDIHVDSTWHNITRFCNEAQADDDCKFVLILGDVINADGNYPHFIESMQTLKKPWFCTAGNHDLYFGQWTEYKKYIGSSTYWFTVNTPNAIDLYICLDTGDGTFGTKQLKWLRDLLQEKKNHNYRHTIVYTHTHMFRRDSSQGHTSNFALEETYEITDLLAKGDVEWYVSGHDHSREISDFKGVKYIIVDTLQDPAEQPAYMIAHVGNRLDYEFVELR